MTLRNRKILLAVAASCGLIGICGLYAYLIEPRRLVVNEYELKVKGWNQAFDGFRAALISDLHAGSNHVTAERLQEIVRITNQLNADAVFILGDHVAQATGKDEAGRMQVLMPPREIAENISGLKAKYGVYVVLGNHDQAYGPSIISEEFSRIGYNVLDGRTAELVSESGSKLRILGLKDQTTIRIWKNFSIEAQRLLAATEGTGDVIVLEHASDVLPVITGDLKISNDIKVFFAGHTHGGQVRLPLLGPPIVPSMFGQKFAAGHTSFENIEVFTTTGIGTSHLPLRFMVPPEVALVTIRRSP